MSQTPFIASRQLASVHSPPSFCSSSRSARLKLMPVYCFGKVTKPPEAAEGWLAGSMKYAANCSTIDKHPAKLQRRQLQPLLLQPQHQQQQHIIAEAAPTLGQPASTAEHTPDPLKMLAKVTADLPSASASSAFANTAASGSCKEPRPLSRNNGQVDSTTSSNLSSHAKNCNKVAATLKPSAVDHINNWAESYQMPDEMSLWDDDGSYFSSQRHLQLAYLPPKSDLPGFAAAVGLMAAWACVFRHAMFEYDMTAPMTWMHIVDGMFSFASLEFLSTGLFITTHDSMHGAVTPNNRFLNDVLGAVCVSLYAWFDFNLMWTKHWDHHNLCGTPKEDPDFHQGDPALLPWFLNFMKGYISWQQFVKLQATVLFFSWCGTALPNMLLFWMGSGLVSAVRLFYFGTYVPHKPRNGADEVMAWAKARSARAPALLSFLRCYHFDMHWEHHRWPFAPWWDLPTARRVRYNAIGSIDD